MAARTCQLTSTVSSLAAVPRLQRRSVSLLGVSTIINPFVGRNLGSLSTIPKNSSPNSQENIQPGVGISSPVIAMSSADVVPGVIIGAGRVGQALEKMGGGKDIVVKRGDSVPADSTGPIYVCTRNDALDAVVEATPEHRRQGMEADSLGCGHPVIYLCSFHIMGKYRGDGWREMN